MEAIRRVEHVAGTKLVVDLPVSFQGQRVEVIVLKLADEEQAAAIPRRQPPAALAGRMTLHDDLVAPAVPENDWEAR